MKGIGKYWHLYLNSWNHIYAQGMGVINTRFSFEAYDEKYAYLGVLIYTLTHIVHERLEEEFNLNKKFI